MLTSRLSTAVSAMLALRVALLLCLTGVLTLPMLLLALGGVVLTGEHGADHVAAVIVSLAAVLLIQLGALVTSVIVIIMVIATRMSIRDVVRTVPFMAVALVRGGGLLGVIALPFVLRPAAAGGHRASAEARTAGRPAAPGWSYDPERGRDIVGFDVINAPDLDDAIAAVAVAEHPMARFGRPEVRAVWPL